jgi:hypothetical protein
MKDTTNPIPTAAKYDESNDIIWVKYKGYTVKLIIDMYDSHFGNFIAEAINARIEFENSLIK